MCKIECNFKYYPIEINTRNLQIDSYHNVLIYHSEYPDIVIKYIPEIDFISFLCNFGGLLGMWLGLSLYELFNDIFSLMTKIAYRKYINLINIKVNQINRVQSINNFVKLPNRLVTRLLKHRNVVR